jgi:hypothetical protein
MKKLLSSKASDLGTDLAQLQTMAVSISASEAGLQIVDRARRKKGWTKAEEAWYQLALTSKATLKRFWAREAIH